MGGWRRYLELRIRAKTGLSSGVIVWAVLALVGAGLTFAFVLVTAFIWLAERYDPLVAALMLSGLFLLITLVALIGCASSHNRTVERAKLELAARKPAPWLEPRLLAGALQTSRAIGGPKLLALVAVVFVAAGFGMHWLGRGHPAVADGRERGPLGA